MTKRLCVALCALLLATSVSAQITVPNTLVPGTTITSSGLNTNFTTIANHALDRLSGGTISGNITVTGGATIDGVQVGVQACVTCNPTFNSVITTTTVTIGTKLTVNDTSQTSATFAGGITAGTGVVGIVSPAGQIPAISSTYFANLSGANLTTLTAANISGVIPQANLGSGSSATKFLRGDQTYQPVHCAWNVVGKTVSYTASVCDLVEQTSGSSITLTLPAAAGCTPTSNIIGLKNDTANVMTVARSSTDTIDGATSFSTAGVQYESYDFVCNAAGNGWMVR